MDWGALLAVVLTVVLVLAVGHGLACWLDRRQRHRVRRPREEQE